MALGKWLIIAGIVLAVLGALLHFLPRFPLGRLPGDMVWQRENLTVYFPLATCLLISVVLSLLLYFFHR